MKTAKSKEVDPRPEHVIGVYEEFEKSAKNWILARLLECDPYDFERIVVDVLLAMKYGVRATVTQKSKDGGIDGVVFEDHLGFSEIIVQAKRWEHTVGRPEVQKFVGTLAGRNAEKGVIITTSQFSSEAREYVTTVSPKVVLIDGWQLADLMFQNDVGVRSEGSIALKSMDSEYFAKPSQKRLGTNNKTVQRTGASRTAK